MLELYEIKPTQEEKSKAFNEKQTKPGSGLKTLKGSSIARCAKYGVGKLVARDIFFHKDYAHIVLKDYPELLEVIKDAPIEYNVLKFNRITHNLSFVECKCFDTEREPMLGWVVTYNPVTKKCTKPRFYHHIYHHKWMMVTNDYKRFDVAESWRWSRTWLSVMAEKADGVDIGKWKRQLKRFNLE